MHSIESIFLEDKHLFLKYFLKCIQRKKSKIIVNKSVSIVISYLYKNQKQTFRVYNDRSHIKTSIMPKIR